MTATGWYGRPATVLTGWLAVGGILLVLSAVFVGVFLLTGPGVPFLVALAILGVVMAGGLARGSRSLQAALRWFGTRQGAVALLVFLGMAVLVVLFLNSR
ncbi:MAG: hypothetical protein ABEJ27_03220 [Halodesulfurarchaeum sp.]